ncbi:hypothetical protein VDIAB_40061 [Vibrio diabolicus]|nr:hypothetical protein VDIAB_40061 [Vibrio diabolicus]
MGMILDDSASRQCDQYANKSLIFYAFNFFLVKVQLLAFESWLLTKNTNFYS